MIANLMFLPMYAGAAANRHRFFYCAKASRRERDAGCEALPREVVQTFKIGARNERMCDENPVANIHPTVKPIELMRWVVRLLTPADGLVLDPFTGSGSTGAAAVLEGAQFHGIERDARYAAIRVVLGTGAGHHENLSLARREADGRFEVAPCAHVGTGDSGYARTARGPAHCLTQRVQRQACGDAAEPQREQTTTVGFPRIVRQDGDLRR